MDYILPVLVFATIGAVAGILLTVVSKIFEVKTDERLEMLQETLPNINCGACGYSGCGDYAQAVLGGEDCNLCKPGGENVVKKLSSIMDVEEKKSEIVKAFVKCGGDCNVTAKKYVYKGIQSCRASNQFYSGSKVCTNGCLGFGDCVNVCPEGAICIDNEIAVINPIKCVGCGLCVKTCPNNLIVIRPEHQNVEVVCSSTDIGKVTRAICRNGCIGCKMCERKCPVNAIKVENNFAIIDYSKCTNCGECVEACKFGVIKKSSI
ncbi:MAG: RnfABCDGE type electron transport complex subunit B [Clostridiales bacterium]|nr:RnfABCDGE type electron transport complex subunit B [Clostridiales bacterium]